MQAMKDFLFGKSKSESSSSSSTSTSETVMQSPPPQNHGSLSGSKKKKYQRKNKQKQKQVQQQQQQVSKEGNKEKNDPSQTINPEQQHGHDKQKQSNTQPNVNLNERQDKENEGNLFEEKPTLSSNGAKPKQQKNDKANKEQETPTKESETDKTLPKASQNAEPNSKSNLNQLEIDLNQIELKMNKSIKSNPANVNVANLSLLETDLEDLGFLDESSKTETKEEKSDNKTKKASKKKKEVLLIDLGNDEEVDETDEEEEEVEEESEEENENENQSENDEENEEIPDEKQYETSSVSSMEVDQYSEDEKEDEIHVSDYDQESNASEDSKLPTYNILLLGETGAGKSTTINAFANYLRYASFDDAIDSKFTQLIPSKFVLPNPETGEPFVIQSGSDDNECQVNDGNSNTQSPMGYTFRTRDRMIRIIDTPGMGDTRGVEIDKKNFDKILSYLNYHKELHGICILIKSNETRKTASFRYCISELLTHLHKSACKNIVFCFTFGRNSFYGPGEGFAILRGFLKNELKEANLELKTGVNCFFIDNEAYRFLVAKKQGYPFPDYQENLYRESWNKSVRQTQTMIGKLIKLEPHNLRQTTSLNHARKLIMELAEPMVQLQKVIHQNVEKIKVYDKKLKQSSKSKNKIMPNLTLEIDELQLRPLENPKTVCTAKNCTDVMVVNGEQKIVYKTVCHNKCFVPGVHSNTVGDPYIEACEVMHSQTNLCKICGCHWKKHMHQSHEYVTVHRTVVDENLQRQLFNANNCISESKDALDGLKKMVSDYQKELKVIRLVAAKFGYMLNRNSNTSFNKFIEPYIDKLIGEEEKMLNAVQNYPRTNLNLLHKIKEQHERDVLELIQAIENETQEQVYLKDIPRLRAELFRLKHTGSQFKQMLHSTGLTQEHAFTFQEKVGLKFNEDENEEEEKIVNTENDDDI